MNRRPLYTIIAVVFVCLVCFAGCAFQKDDKTAEHREALALYYRLETAGPVVIDTSTNNNDGINSGAGVKVQGRAGYCFTFGGGGQHILTADSDSLDVIADFTIDLWSFRGADAAMLPLVSKWQTGQQVFRLFLADHFPVLELSSDGSSVMQVTASSAIPLNQWSRITAVRQGDTVEIFVDSALAGNGTFEGPLFQSDADLLVGAAQDSWQGKVDELKIYAAAVFPDEDAAAPSDTIDLSAGTPGLSQARLNWTAPGNGAGEGTAFFYDLRISTAPITAANFNDASICADIPAPGPIGTAEEYLLTGLLPGTLYYAAVKAIDEAGNLSGISNICQLATHAALTAPVLESAVAAVDQIDLAWQSGGNIDVFYHVYRAENGGEFSKILTVPDLTAADLLITPDTEYSYKLCAADAFGEEGPFSNILIYQPGFTDSDGDGMDDTWEVSHGLDPTDPDDAGLDSDGDGLTNLDEYNAGTDPALADSDGDGLSDGSEAAGGTNPLAADPDDIDGDGILNDEDDDNDNDTLPDTWEIANGCNPFDASDATQDDDGDHLINRYEFLNGGDPADPDSDDDGVVDGYDERPGDPAIIISQEKRELVHIAGAGTESATAAGGLAVDVGLGTPMGLFCSDTLQLYIADAESNSVRVVDLTDGSIRTLIGVAGAPGYAGDGQRAANGLLNGPHDVAVSGGIVLISDRDNHRIRAINATDAEATVYGQLIGPGEIITIAGTGSAGYEVADTAALETELNQPWGLALDASGGLYFSEYGNHIVRHLDSSGIISLIAGSGGVSGYAGEDCDPLDALLQGPAGLEYADGRLFLADNGNHIVRIIDLATDTIRTLAGTPEVRGVAGDGLAAVAARLYSPVDVACGLGDHVYVSDEHSIRVIQSDGSIQRTAGNLYSAGLGTAPLNLILQGGGLAVSVLNDLYAGRREQGQVSRIPFASRSHFIDIKAGLYQGASASPENTASGYPAGAAFIDPLDLVRNAEGEIVYVDAQLQNLRRLTAGIEGLDVVDQTLPGLYSGIADLETLTRGGGSVYLFTDKDAHLLYAFNTCPGPETVFGHSIAPGGIAAVAGNGSTVPGPFFDAMGDPASASAMAVGLAPLSMAYGSTSEGDTVYIVSLTADKGPVLLKLDASGTVMPVAGGGSTASYDGTAALEVAWGTHTAVSLDPGSNTVYGTDHDQHVVFAYAAGSGTLSLIAGEEGVSGYEEQAVLPAVNAHVNSPGAIVWQDGKIIFADAGNRRLRRIDMGSGIISDLAGTGTCAMTGSGLVAGEAFLSDQVCLAADGIGLLAGDRVNHVIASVAAPADSDGDGLTDMSEERVGSNPDSTDTDGDGLSDYDELIISATSPTNTDSDGDGLTDKEEVDAGSDPARKNETYPLSDGDFDDDGENDDTDNDIDNDGIDNDEDPEVYTPSILHVEYEGTEIPNGYIKTYDDEVSDRYVELKIEVNHPDTGIALYANGTKLYIPRDGEAKWQVAHLYPREGQPGARAIGTKVSCKIRLPLEFAENEIAQCSYPVTIKAVWNRSNGLTGTDSFNFAVVKDAPIPGGGGGPPSLPPTPATRFHAGETESTYVYGYNDISITAGYVFCVLGDENDTGIENEYIDALAKAVSDHQPANQPTGKITISGLPGNPSSIELHPEGRVFDQGFDREPPSNYSFEVEYPASLQSAVWVPLVTNGHDGDNPAGTLTLSASGPEGSDTREQGYWFDGLQGSLRNITDVRAPFSATNVIITADANPGTGLFNIAINLKLTDWLYGCYRKTGGTIARPTMLLYDIAAENSYDIPFIDSLGDFMLDFGGTVSDLPLDEGCNRFLLVARNAGGDVCAEPLDIWVNEGTITSIVKNSSWDNGRLGELDMSCPMNLGDKGPETFDISCVSTRTHGPAWNPTFAFSDLAETLGARAYIYPLPRGNAVADFPVPLFGDPGGKDEDAVGLVYGRPGEYIEVNGGKLSSFVTDITKYKGMLQQEISSSWTLADVLVPGIVYRFVLKPSTAEDLSGLSFQAFVACDESSGASSGMPDQQSDPGKSVLRLSHDGAYDSASFQVVLSEDDAAVGNYLVMRPHGEAHAYLGTAEYGAHHYSESLRYRAIELLDRTTIDSKEPPVPAASGVSPVCGVGVLAHSGEFVESCADLSLPGRGMGISIVRTYCSQNYARSAMGNNWDFNFNKRIYWDAYSSGTKDVYYYDGAGREYKFTNPQAVTDLPGFLEYTGPAGLFARLRRNPDHSFTLKTPGGTRFHFRPVFEDDRWFQRLDEIRDTNDNVITCIYDSQGRLERILDTLQRNIDFHYDRHNNISRIEDFSGRFVTYEYYREAGYSALDGAQGLGCEGDLRSVTFQGTKDQPMFRKVGYEYMTEGTRFAKHNLTKIKRYYASDNAVDMLVNVYDDQDRVIAQYTADSKKPIQIVYEDTVTQVRDRNAIETYYSFGAGRASGLLTALTEKDVTVVGPVIEGEAQKEEIKDLITSFEYNSNNLLTSSVDYPDGRKADYLYNHSNSDPRRKGDLKSVTITPGDPDVGIEDDFASLSQSYGYNYEETSNQDDFTRQVRRTTARGNEWKSEYDDRGNLTRTVPPEAAVGGTVTWSEIEYNRRGQPVTIKRKSGPNPASAGTLLAESMIYYFSDAFSYSAGNIPEQYESGDSGASVSITGVNSTGSFPGKTETTFYWPDQSSGDTTSDSLTTHQDLNGLGITIRAYDPTEDRLSSDRNPAQEIDTLEAAYKDGPSHYPLNIMAFTRNNHGECTTASRSYLSQAPGMDENPEIGDSVSTTHQYTAEGRALSSKLWGVGKYETSVNAFGPEGELRKVTQPERAPVEFTYNRRYQLEKTACGETEVNRAFTVSGNLRRIIYSGGVTVNHYYDGFQRLRRTSMSSGRHMTWTYDKDGNCTEQYAGTTKGDDYIKHTSLFDEAGRNYSSSQEGDNDRKNTRTVKADNFRTVAKDTFDKEAVTVRDGLGRIVQTFIPGGHRTAYYYDDKSRVVRIEEREYDPEAQGHQIYITETVYAKDGLHAEIKHYLEGKEPEARTVSLDYDSDGNLIKRIDPELNEVRYYADEAGRTKKIERITEKRTETDYDAVTTRVEFNWWGRIKAAYDANGSATEYRYDWRNRPIRMLNPDGTSRSLTYNSSGQIENLTLETETVVTNFYDSENRLSWREIARGDGVDGTTREDFTYDLLGRPNGSTDDNGGLFSVSRHYAFDNMGDVISETQSVTNTPDRLIGFGYEDDGALKTVAYPSGPGMKIERDDLRRPIEYQTSNGFGSGATLTSSVKYTYIGPSRVRERLTCQGSVELFKERFTYTSQREISDLDYTFPNIGGQTHGFEYERDKVGNVTEKTVKHKIGALIGLTKEYEYDKLYRMVGYNSNGDLRSWELDDAGNPLKVIGGGGAAINTFNVMNELRLHNGNELPYTEDGCLQSRGPGELFTYDYRGRMVTAVTVKGVSFTDIENRFPLELNADSEDPATPIVNVADGIRNDSVEPGEVFQTAEGYDEHAIELAFTDGFGQSKEHTLNYIDLYLPTELGQVGGFRLEYRDYGGAVHSLTASEVKPSMQFALDADGQTFRPGLNSATGAPYHLYQIDLKDSVHATAIRYVQPAVSGPESAPNIASINEIDVGVRSAHTASYFYGTDNIRVKAIVDGIETEYVTSGGRVLEEYEVYSGEGGPASRKLMARYLYGNGIDEPIAMERDLDRNDNLDENELFYYLRDANANTTGLTDRDGRIVELYDYGPYGKVKVLDRYGNIQYNPVTGEPLRESQYGNPYMFQSRRYDHWSGLYYFRNRYYDPGQGRFITRDPARADRLGNLYGFVNNNPVNYVDPWGLDYVSVNKETGAASWVPELKLNWWQVWHADLPGAVVIGHLDGGIVTVAEYFGGGVISYSDLTAKLSALQGGAALSDHQGLFGQLRLKFRIDRAQAELEKKMHDFSKAEQAWEDYKNKLKKKAFNKVLDRSHEELISAADGIVSASERFCRNSDFLKFRLAIFSDIERYFGVGDGKITSLDELKVLYAKYLRGVDIGELISAGGKIKTLCSVVSQLIGNDNKFSKEFDYDYDYLSDALESFSKLQGTIGVLNTCTGFFDDVGLSMVSEQLQQMQNILDEMLPLLEGIAERTQEIEKKLPLLKGQYSDATDGGIFMQLTIIQASPRYRGRILNAHSKRLSDPNH